MTRNDFESLMRQLENNWKNMSLADKAQYKTEVAKLNQKKIKRNARSSSASRGDSGARSRSAARAAPSKRRSGGAAASKSQAKSSSGTSGRSRPRSRSAAAGAGKKKSGSTRKHSDDSGRSVTSPKVKRPMNAFAAYVKEQTANTRIKKEGVQQIISKLNENWKKMSQAEKDNYKKKALEHNKSVALKRKKKN